MYTRLKQDPRSVYTLSQIRNLMTDIKKDMGLPKSITSARMMEIIKSSNKFKDIVISFPSEKYTRYTWGKESLYEVLLSLDNNAYFCHLSALYFHKLLDQDISDIYLNITLGRQNRENSVRLRLRSARAYLYLKAMPDTAEES